MNPGPLQGKLWPAHLDAGEDPGSAQGVCLWLHAAANRNPGADKPVRPFQGGAARQERAQLPTCVSPEGSSSQRKPQGKRVTPGRLRQPRGLCSSLGNKLIWCPTAPCPPSSRSSPALPMSRWLISCVGVRRPCLRDKPARLTLSMSEHSIFCVSIPSRENTQALIKGDRSPTQGDKNSAGPASRLAPSAFAGKQSGREKGRPRGSRFEARGLFKCLGVGHAQDPCVPLHCHTHAIAWLA